MADHNTLVADFQAISGASESVGRGFLERAGWNLEMAMSNYFDNPTAGDTATVQQPPPLGVVGPSSTTTNLSVVVPPPVVDDDSKIGLFVKNSDVVIPLRGLTVRADVVDLAAEVEIAQLFVNNTENPIEAVFVFQQEESTIFAIEVDIDGRKVKGVCKEKGEAFAHYDDSISSGHGAVLLEKGSKDEFKLSVGNLPPGKEATVTVKYVTELEAEGEALRVALPITRTPLVAGRDAAASKTTTTDTTTTTTTPSSEEGEKQIKEGLNVSINVRMSSPILGIEAASGHELDIQVDGNTAKVEYSSIGKNNVSFETLKFIIGFAESFRPRLILEEENDGESALLVSFNPRIKEAVKAAMPLEFDEETYQPFSEIIFLVDRSGSMAGSRMNQAKNALHLFLRSLPEGTQFNIYGFGSSFVKLFPSSVEYSGNTFQAATQHVNEMAATLAGTDILPPLRDILGQGANPDYPRQLFCLTDGEVENTNAVIEYIRKNGQGTRIFTFGIGADASPTLVRGMSKAGRGEAEFVASGTRLEPVVLRQLQRALQPILKNTHVDWGEKLQSKIRQSPPIIPPLFEGERVVLYFYLEKGLTLEDLKFAEVALKAQVADGDSKDVIFPLKFDAEEMVVYGEAEDKKLVHRLGAAALIKHLSQDKAKGKENKDEITRLGVRYQLASQYTSFVAVSERDEATEGSLVQVDTNKAILDGLTGGEVAVKDSLSALQDHAFMEVDDLLAAPLTEGGISRRRLSLNSYNAASSDDDEEEADGDYDGYSLASTSDLGGYGAASLGMGGGGAFGYGAPPASMPAPTYPGAANPASAVTSLVGALSSLKSALVSASAGPAPPPPASEPSMPITVGDIRKAVPLPTTAGDDWECKDKENEAEEKRVHVELERKEEEKKERKKKEHRRDREEEDRRRVAEMDEVKKRCEEERRGAERPSSRGSSAPERERGITLSIDTSLHAGSRAMKSLAPSGRGAAPAPQRPQQQQQQHQPQQPQAPKLVVNAHMRPLDKLVQLQQFNGSWILSAELVELLKAKSAEAVSAAVPEGKKYEDSLWVTALALALLEEAFADAKEEWKLLASKALKWLKAQTKKDGLDSQTLLEDAKGVVTQWYA